MNARYTHVVRRPMEVPTFMNVKGRIVSHEGPFLVRFDATEGVTGLSRDGVEVPLGPKGRSFDYILKQHEYTEIVPAILQPGQFHPRVFRGGPLVPHLIKHNKEHVSALSASAPLFERLAVVVRTLEPVPAHLEAYGQELRHLLILACTEVENAWKAILIANDYQGWSNQPPGEQGKLRASTSDYVKLLVPLRLVAWRLAFWPGPLLAPVQPFADWDPKTPTASLSWYDGYNATKHGRERALDRATLRNLLGASAALWVMIASQFGEERLSRPPFDIFSPEDRAQWPIDHLYFASAAGSWSEVPLPL